MKYQFKSLQQIISIFQQDKPLGVTEIALLIGKSRTIVHKYLKELVSQKKLKKIGRSPHTKYELTGTELSKIIPQKFEKSLFAPDFSDRKTIDDIFFKFSPDGEKLEGFDGMKKWCNSRNFNIEEKFKNYISIYNHISSIQDKCGLLSALQGFGSHFEEVYLDNISYADQYRWMEFGRGKLAEITFYSKLSQNKELIAQAISEILPKIECLIQKEKFDAIAITPWSIERKNQLLLFLKNSLKDFQIPFINIIKYSSSGISIPQKSLKTSDQRIQNARNTIIVDEKKVNKYSKVLLIDDFVGSGATLNETAHKLKVEGVDYVHGFAFVGNLDLDYDVINEV